MSIDMFPDAAVEYIIEKESPTIDMLCAGPEDPVFGVYYYHDDTAYITPWNEGAVQRLAAAEDGRGKFYFVIDEFSLTVGEQPGTGVGTDPLVIVAGRGVSEPVAVQA